MNDIEKLLGLRPKMQSKVDVQFTSATLERISRIEQAKPPQKGFSIMKLSILRPLQGLSAGTLVAIICTLSVSAAAVIYLWHQTSVTPLGSNGKVSTFQTSGCPDFYKLQNDQAALQKANLDHFKKFELRPDVKALPVEEQQKIIQAYCEVNQLRAFASSKWQASKASFNDVGSAVKITSLSPNELRGEQLYYNPDQPSEDMAQTLSIPLDEKTEWLIDGKKGTATDFKIGDVVAAIVEYAPKSALKTLAVAKLPLGLAYYSPRTQSMLIPLNPCVGTKDEECADIQMRSSLLFDASIQAPLNRQDAKEIQAKIVSINGDTFELKSRGGKFFSLVLPDAKVENGDINNIHLEKGDYLHIHYNGARGLSDKNATRVDLLLYSPNGKFGPYLKYKD